MKIDVSILLGNYAISCSLKDFLDKAAAKGTPEISFTVAGKKVEQCCNSHIILSDFSSLKHIPQECYDPCKIIILDTGLEKDTIVSLFLTEKISGLISSESDASMIIKAIRTVSQNEVWIDNDTVKALIEHKKSRALSHDAAKLSERELSIVRLVKQGYRNKEISQVLSVSEQTVKAHLNRVFRKMQVSGRTELVARISDQL